MEKRIMQAYQTHIGKIAELKNFVGKELGLSPWINITQENINTFAKVTEDEQWIHVDPVLSAQHSPYKKTIAHGFMVLSYASKFAYDTYSIGDAGMGLNYGLNKVRFPNATLSGAQLRGRVSLIECHDIEGGAQFTIKIVFELEGQEKPACVAEFLARVYRK